MLAKLHYTEDRRDKLRQTVCTVCQQFASQLAARKSILGRMSGATVTLEYDGSDVIDDLVALAQHVYSTLRALQAADYDGLDRVRQFCRQARAELPGIELFGVKSMEEQLQGSREGAGQLRHQCKLTLPEELRHWAVLFEQHAPEPSLQTIVDGLRKDAWASKVNAT